MAASYTQTDVLPVHPSVQKGATLVDMDNYRALYRESMENNSGFWAKVAKEQLTWFRDFDDVTTGSFEEGHMEWYLGGKLNVSYNCVDRHARTNPDKVAILWEGDTPDQIRKITFKELLVEVCRVANALLSLGVRKGDTVTIYMPMIPEAAFAMLACTRIGAVHSVVFAGFSATSLRQRIEDAKSPVVITANVGLRGGKVIPLKAITDQAVQNLHLVKSVLVTQRTDAEVPWDASRDVWWHELVPRQRCYVAPEWLDAEDLMFILYTSGSTGKPKGMAHTTGGYLTYSSYTTKHVFDLHEDTLYACVADIGWITGHSYIVYGPLVNNVTTLMFESVPTFPDPGRYWDMVQRHKINVLYTAPTAIRALMRFGDSYPKKYDLSSLRVLGTVGEPINPEAWEWYHAIQPTATIVDTFWQTETGGHVVTGYGGVTPMKPGSASLPALGIECSVLDAKTGKEIEGNDVSGVLCIKRPWPGMARTIHGDHSRFLAVYLQPYKGYYFTGDGCYRDKDGYIWITGRVDDVLNLSGHRIGTAEVESALVSHDDCAEAAVVGRPHPVKGESIFCYVILAKGVEKSDEMAKKLKLQVRSVIGAWATPDDVCIVESLPKTRSGKIMRRILRKIAAGERDLSKIGDVSTLADSTAVDKVITAVDALGEPCS